MPRRRINWLGWIFLAAGLLYVSNAPRVYVGIFGDDARDILAAKSLCQGRYESFQDSAHPPLNFPLPGFPFLLAPFVALCGPHWSLMKIIPIASALGSGLLFWLFMGDRIRSLVRVTLLSLFLFNPSTVYLSGVVIADTFFVCLILSVFCLLRNLLNGKSIRSEWLLGLLLAWTAFVRPEGLFLVMAVLASLVYTKRYRSIPFVLLPSVGLGLAWIARNLYFTQRVSGYSEIWKMSVQPLSDQSVLLSYWTQQFVSWFWEMLAGISFGGIIRWWMVIPAVSAGILALWGYFSYLNEKAEPGGFALGVGFFVGSYGVLHAVWLAVHPHYFFPLLPFSLLFLAKAAEEGRRHWSRLSNIVMMGIAVTGVAYGAQDYHVAFSPRGMPTESQEPRSTFTWIRAHIPQDATHKVLAVRAPTVTLYTGDYSLAALPAHNTEEFRFELLLNHVSHVLIEPAPIAFVASGRRFDPVYTWKRSGHWLSHWKEAFSLVFQNDMEGSTIYEIKPDAAFLASYQKYQEASQMVGHGQISEGMKLLAESLKINPHLTSALNSYAAVVLEMGGPLALAEHRLREATRLRPDFALAWMNLSRLHEKMHRTNEAQQEYRIAQSLNAKIN